MVLADFHENRLSGILLVDFHETRLSDSHNSLKVINEFLPMPLSFLTDDGRIR